MKIHVCPLCGEVADWSDDYGWSLLCEHPPYDGIEAVEIEGRIVGGQLVFDLPDAEEWKRTVGAGLLDKQMADLVRRINWMALTCDERVEVKRRQREAGGFQALLGDEMHYSMLLYMSSTSRLVFGGSRTESVPCPRCHEFFCENASTRVVPGTDLRGAFSIEPGFKV